MIFPIMPERARKIIEKVAGRHGFLPEEICVGGVPGREAAVARLEVRMALRSHYSAADTAIWLGEPAPFKRREKLTPPENTPDMVFSLWRGPIDRADRRRTMAEIVEEVAELYGVTVEQIKGPSQARDLTRPRHHAMWLMCQQAHLNRSIIGRFLGDRDPSTVLHGERCHTARVAAEWSGREAA